MPNFLDDEFPTFEVDGIWIPSNLSLENQKKYLLIKKTILHLQQEAKDLERLAAKRNWKIVG